MLRHKHFQVQDRLCRGRTYTVTINWARHTCTRSMTLAVTTGLDTGPASPPIISTAAAKRSTRVRSVSLTQHMASSQGRRGPCAPIISSLVPLSYFFFLFTSSYKCGTSFFSASSLSQLWCQKFTIVFPLPMDDIVEVLRSRRPTVLYRTSIPIHKACPSHSILSITNTILGPTITIFVKVEHTNASYSLRS